MQIVGKDIQLLQSWNVIDSFHPQLHWGLFKYCSFRAVNTNEVVETRQRFKTPEVSTSNSPGFAPGSDHTTITNPGVGCLPIN